MCTLGVLGQHHVPADGVREGCKGQAGTGYPSFKRARAGFKTKTAGGQRATGSLLLALGRFSGPRAEDCRAPRVEARQQGLQAKSKSSHKGIVGVRDEPSTSLPGREITARLASIHLFRCLGHWPPHTRSMVSRTGGRRWLSVSSWRRNGHPLKVIVAIRNTLRTGWPG